MKEKIEKNYKISIYNEGAEYNNPANEFYKHINTFVLGNIVRIPIIPNYNIPKFSSTLKLEIFNPDLVSSSDEATLFKIQTSDDLVIITHDKQDGQIAKWEREGDCLYIYFISARKMELILKEIEQMMDKEFFDLETRRDYFRLDSLKNKFYIIKLIDEILKNHTEILTEYKRKILCYS